jgi:hypothetical protein
MKAVALLVVALVPGLAACGKGSSEKKGSLCLAAAPKNVLAGGAYQDKTVEIRFRNNRYPVPGDQVMIWDVHENEGVEAMVDGKVKESFRTHFDKLGPDLCYHFRAAAPGIKEGFVLETASACGCMGGSDAGSGSTK